MELGADINAADKNGRTCLMIAAGGCNPASVQRLIDLGARTDDRDSEGETALFKTVQQERS